MEQNDKAIEQNDDCNDNNNNEVSNIYNDDNSEQ